MDATGAFGQVVVSIYWPSVLKDAARLLIDCPLRALPLLGASPDGRGFEWLPDPARCPQSLDEAIHWCASLKASPVDVDEDVEADGAQEEGPCRFIVGGTLAPLARKLRMVGIDCAIAGEYVRKDVPGLQGLMRVRVDVSLQAA